jgi:CBS domain-containing membrane protein
MLGHRVLEIHPVIPLYQNMGIEFAILSYAGRVSISAAVDPKLVPDAETIPQYLAEEAAELKRALEVAPRAGVPARDAREAPRVRDLMTSPVVVVTPDDRLTTAYAIMRARRIRHLPVVDGTDRLVGLVTHRDLLAASSSSIIAHDEEDRVRLLSWARVGDMMETHLSIARPEESALEAGERLLRHKIGCLPVVEGEARLVGVVTEEDFLRWATTHMARAS